MSPFASCQFAWLRVSPGLSSAQVARPPRSWRRQREVKPITVRRRLIERDPCCSSPIPHFVRSSYNGLQSPIGITLFPFLFLFLPSLILCCSGRVLLPDSEGAEGL